MLASEGAACLPHQSSKTLSADYMPGCRLVQCQSSMSDSRPIMPTYRNFQSHGPNGNDIYRERDAGRSTSFPHREWQGACASVSEFLILSFPKGVRKSDRLADIRTICWLRNAEQHWILFNVIDAPRHHYSSYATSKIKDRPDINRCAAGNASCAVRGETSLRSRAIPAKALLSDILALRKDPSKA